MDADDVDPVDGAAELRMLRAKAYGPDGELSADELARLQELEGQQAAGASAPVPLVEPAATPESPAAPAPATDLQGLLRDDDAPETLPESLTDDLPDPPRRRWPLVAAASAGILAVGLGIGWAIWGWDSQATALAVAHSALQAEMEAEEEYDPGTLVPVAEQYGVVVWRADRSNGEELCVIITSDDANHQGCVSYEQLADSSWPTATAMVPEGQERAGDQLAAGLIPTATGELTPFFQVWSNDPSLVESMYSDEELEQLRAVEDAGYAGNSLSIIGYDGETAVWSNWDTGNLCVIAATDAGIISACAESAEDTVGVTATVNGIETRYVVSQSNMYPPQLTVYKLGGGSAGE